MVLSPLYNFSLAIPILTIGRPATLGSWVPWDFDSKHSSGAILSFIHINYNLVGTIAGLPRWSTGKESTCRCRRGRRDGRSVGQEDSLEEEMATHSSTLAWRIPWTEEPDGLQSIASQSWTQLKRLSTAHKPKNGISRVLGTGQPNNSTSQSQTYLIWDGFKIHLPKLGHSLQFIWQAKTAKYQVRFKNF